MVEKVLTIAILSYKRPLFLDSLLSNLTSYIDELDLSSRIKIIVRINPCDGFDYQIIYKKYSKLDYISINENETNIGAIKSFYKVFNNINTKYFWQLGDDDNINIQALKICFYCIKLDLDYIIFNYSYYKLVNNKRINCGNLLNKIDSNRYIDKPLDLIKKCSIHLGFVSIFVVKTSIYKYLFNEINNIGQRENLPDCNLKPLLMVIYTLSSGYKGYLVNDLCLEGFHPGDSSSIDTDYGPLTKFVLEHKLWILYFNNLYKNKNKNKILNYLFFGFIRKFFSRAVVTTYESDFDSLIIELSKLVKNNKFLFKTIFLSLFIYRFLVRNLIIYFKRFGLFPNIRIYFD